MKSQLRKVNDQGIHYDALVISCPGCAEKGFHGIKMLPVNSISKSPSWDWNEDLLLPTLAPSILSRQNDFVCHSYLKDGVFEFLTDSTHSFSGQSIPMLDLPAYIEKEV